MSTFACSYTFIIIPCLMDLHRKLNIKMEITDTQIFGSTCENQCCFLKVPPLCFLLSAASAAEGSVPEPSHPE